MSKLSFKSKMCLIVSVAIMASFFVVQSLLVLKVLESGYSYNLFGYGCILLFSPVFYVFVREFLDEVESNKKELLDEVMRKNLYLEHAAKILRHDMHSGINTYIPRGIRSLTRRLGKERIEELKLEAPLRLLTEGLEHSQQVYDGIYQFTDLVRENSVMKREVINLTDVLEKYFKRVSYKDQILLSPDLPEASINQSLFCTAVDNLVRNGIKYNDQDTKWVRIEMQDDGTLGIRDNGRGLTQEEFDHLSKPYQRKENQKETGTGLGLNITIAIFKEHGFSVKVEKQETGTLIKVSIND